MAQTLDDIRAAAQAGKLKSPAASVPPKSPAAIAADPLGSLRAQLKAGNAPTAQPAEAPWPGTGIPGRHNPSGK